MRVLHQGQPLGTRARRPVDRLELAVRGGDELTADEGQIRSRAPLGALLW
jgi:hypothetical protein